MTELSRFLRYSIPGAIFIFELAFFALTNGKLSNHVSENLNWIVAIGFIFASSVLGYIFSCLHHILLPSHDVESVRGLLEKEYPELITKIDPISWGVFNAIWYSKSESSEVIKGATSKSKDISDWLHGAGASLIATIFAFITTLIWIVYDCLKYHSSPNLEILFAITLNVILIFVFFCSLEKLKFQLRDFVASCIIIALERKGIAAPKIELFFDYLKRVIK
ncbi:hypothetical protein CH352_18855 [Leptospira hartskeerlii]|uniref:Uncharacterized protein n=1 Tax=Leptospira hartskeerlii TaxID=2023177 RepID=A0A2M9X8A8_9LEPT|nr:hypothetical protein [Leptospira hartskeerlii]PJZ23894.1 hypothetical protein CH357_18790 [Leptospira hartskeerlii]PJZ31916.1 hypothetical protein CH352_18855 [Leptospira hartskeerlii]